MGQNMTSLDDALRSAFSLIGISEIPSAFDLKILKEFIFLKLGNFTPQDIKQAFMMIANNEIEADIKNFGRFSPQYLGSVMAAYQIHLNTAIMEKRRFDEREVMKKEKTPEEIEAEKQKWEKIFLSEIIIPSYNQYCESGDFIIKMKDAVVVFNYLVEKNLLKLTEADQKQIRIDAEKLYNFENDGKQNARDSKQISEMFRKNTLRRYRRFIAIEKCFEKLKQENFKF